MRRFVAVAFLVLAPVLGGCELLESPSSSEPSQPSGPEGPKTTCEDVTSHDHNWDNDMLCTRADGSQFYTSYDGARKYR